MPPRTRPRGALPFVISAVTFVLAGTLTSRTTRAGAPAENDLARIVAKVDALIADGWDEAGVTPADTTTDAELLRRLYLDIAGRIPTADEAREFLVSSAPDKRERLRDELLRSSDFAAHWARQTSILLLGRDRERLPRPVDPRGFETWLREHFERGTRHDALVRELVTAAGNPVDSPGVNYLLRFEQKPEDIAESVASRFLGISIGCARCHDHPYESWTQEDFFGLAASFGGLTIDRPTRAERRTRGAFRMKAESLQAASSKEALSPDERRRMAMSLREGSDALRRTVRLMDDPHARFIAELDGQRERFPARFPDGTVPEDDYRERFAEWLVAPDNPFFAKATVNRVWAALFGRGLVDPVDAFGAGNPPSHPGVLDRLAADFIDNGYDLRRLLAILTSSKTYQLSSRYAPERPLPAPELFAVARPRRLPPEQLFESLVTMGGLEDRPRFAAERDRFLRHFVFLFDTDAVDDIEVARGSIPQSLFLLNGGVTNEAIHFRFRRREESVEEIYLAVLSRFPTSEERSLIEAYFAPGDPKAQRDLRWALVNSSEFLMVH